MKRYVMIYSILFFAAQTDNIAGILRSIRDINNVDHYLEPK